MSSPVIQTTRPSLLAEDAMVDLIDMVREPFLWYAPDSPDDEIRRLLMGNGSSFVDVILIDDQPSGFAAHYSVDFHGATIDYRAGTCILPHARGNGIYRQLIARALSTASYDYISARTQNRIVYQTIQSFCKDGLLYPGPELVVPSEIGAIAAVVSKSPVEPETLIVRNAHDFVRKDRSFMNTSDTAIERFFTDQLGPDDGFMLVGVLPKEGSVDQPSQ